MFAEFVTIFFSFKSLILLSLLTFFLFKYNFLFNISAISLLLCLFIFDCVELILPFLLTLLFISFKNNLILLSFILRSELLFLFVFLLLKLDFILRKEFGYSLIVNNLVLLNPDLLNPLGS